MSTAPMQAVLVTGLIFVGLVQATIVTVCSWVQGLSRPEGTGLSSHWYLPPLFWPLALIIFLFLSPQWSLGEMRFNLDAPFMAWHSTDPGHMVRLWVSVLTVTHCTQKPLWCMWSKSCTNLWVQRFRGSGDILYQEVVVDALTWELCWHLTFIYRWCWYHVSS